jgi:hypothetical protein
MKSIDVTENQIPPFAGNINFNAQHSPVGAFMSFTCGHFGSGGGIGVEIGKPANQNVIVGVKRGGRKSKAALRCFPFARGGSVVSKSADYDVEHAAGGAAPAATQGARLEYFGPDEIRRHYGWATDTWVAPPITFSLYSPFAPIPEPGSDPDRLQDALLPAVVATLKVDNRGGTEPMTGVFALDFPDAGTRIIGDDVDDVPQDAPETSAAGSRRVGFAWRRTLGVLATVDSEDAGEGGPFVLQRWSVVDGLEDDNPVHALGNCGGVGIEVPPGQVRTVVLAIGVYLDGIVTTGLEGRYYYARFYGSLEHVLSAALDRAAAVRARAAALDFRLLTSGLSADQQFLVAHATRSYYGSTQLLDVGGEPFWVVNEGEYCMMNTLDLSIDHAFWELDHNPWVVRNVLDNFVRRYSYVDQLRRRDDRLQDGGISFAHDMGAHNNFSPAGHSSYELPRLTGCFSYMTAEQLCNWTLLAATYVARTGDTAWARRNRHLIDACGQSLLARCGGTGVIQFDSSRCQGGAEITTYDSLDHSLAQTRNNLYIAVKCWATFLAIQRLVGACGDAIAADDGYNQWTGHAHAAAETVVRNIRQDGVIPAVFEPDSPGYLSRILPACEGLLYPLVWQNADTLKPNGTFAPLLRALKTHTLRLLKDELRRNLFADGGIKLSSTSNNSWVSKIAVFQHVCRAVFDLDGDREVREIFAAADAAHVRWQTDGSGYWACSDQFVSGVAKGSRYYPRIITAALWLARTGVEDIPDTRPAVPTAGSR